MGSTVSAKKVDSAVLVREWRMRAATAHVYRRCADEMAACSGSPAALLLIADRWLEEAKVMAAEELVDIEYSYRLADALQECVAELLDAVRPHVEHQK